MFPNISCENNGNILQDVPAKSISLVSLIFYTHSANNGAIASSFAFKTPSRAATCSIVACTELLTSISWLKHWHVWIALLILAHSAFKIHARASSSCAIELAMASTAAHPGLTHGIKLALFVSFIYFLSFIVVVLYYMDRDEKRDRPGIAVQTH